MGITQFLDFHIAQGNFSLLACVQLLEELDRVLQYPKFQRYFDDETRIRFVALVAGLGELVDIPDNIPQLLRDPNDDYLIACALAGYADFMISGDKDLLEHCRGINPPATPTKPPEGGSESALAGLAGIARTFHVRAGWKIKRDSRSPTASHCFSLFTSH